MSGIRFPETETCFHNIYNKKGFRNTEVMQVPENREDSRHLSNCSNFVSDYFFPCGSCTYFQWNKRESQAHEYLQSHRFKSASNSTQLFKFSTLHKRPVPKHLRAQSYKIMASECQDHHHLCGHKPRKSLGCSQWFARASKHLNYHPLPCSNYHNPFAKILHLKFFTDICVYQDIGMQPNTEAKETLKP